MKRMIQLSKDSVLVEGSEHPFKFMVVEDDVTLRPYPNSEVTLKAFPDNGVRVSPNPVPTDENAIGECVLSLPEGVVGSFNLGIVQ
jgi:hypothetical protein